MTPATPVHRSPCGTCLPRCAVASPTLSGTIETEGDSFTDGRVSVEINADSIDTNDAQRDGHLRTNDFFGTGENPSITFRSTSVTPRSDNQFMIHGDLTIRGVTRPVTPGSRI